MNKEFDFSFTATYVYICNVIRWMLPKSITLKGMYAYAKKQH